MIASFSPFRCVSAMACFAVALAASAQDTPQAKIISRETVADAGYTEVVLPAPAAAFPGLRVRTWAPMTGGGPRAPAANAVVIIDGQADAGLAAAMARQAESAQAGQGLWVVTVSPSDEPVMADFRRRAWTAAEVASLASFVVEYTRPDARPPGGWGEVSLVGAGRGGDVVLAAFAMSPAGFDQFHARYIQGAPDALSALSSGVPADVPGGRDITLGFSWTFDGMSPADPAVDAFLEAARSQGYRTEWVVNETDEAFLKRILRR